MRPVGRGGAGAFHLPAGILYRTSFASGMEEVSAIAVCKVCGSCATFVKDEDRSAFFVITSHLSEAQQKTPVHQAAHQRPVHAHSKHNSGRPSRSLPPQPAQTTASLSRELRKAESPSKSLSPFDTSIINPPPTNNPYTHNVKTLKASPRPASCPLPQRQPPAQATVSSPFPPTALHIKREENPTFTRKKRNFFLTTAPHHAPQRKICTSSSDHPTQLFNTYRYHDMRLFFDPQTVAPLVQQKRAHIPRQSVPQYTSASHCAACRAAFRQ